MTSISLETARKLLGGNTKSKDALVNAQYTERWPNDPDLVRIAKSVSEGRTTVILGSGKRFRIKYINQKVIRINPFSIFDFVPMGFFERKKLDEALITKIDVDNL